MEHDWRKFAIVNDTVMACRICGDVQGKRNRPCPGKDEASFVGYLINSPDLQEKDKPLTDYSI